VRHNGSRHTLLKLLAIFFRRKTTNPVSLPLLCHFFSVFLLGQHIKLFVRQFTALKLDDNQQVGANINLSQSDLYE